MIIKVCGMRDAYNIREVENLGIDWLGFILYPKSPRYVAAKPDYMPLRAQRVGVFVNADASTICQQASALGLNLVQLHGSETPQFCRDIKAQLPEVKLIKAFSIKDAESLKPTEQYDGIVDYFLFDTHCPDYGGSGQTFDHQLLTAYCGNTPFLLSGGLSVDNIEDLKSFNHPRLAGYDLNSRFEIEPALKNPHLIQQFIDAITSNT